MMLNKGQRVKVARNYIIRGANVGRYGTVECVRGKKATVRLDGDDYTTEWFIDELEEV